MARLYVLIFLAAFCFSQTSGSSDLLKEFVRRVRQIEITRDDLPTMVGNINDNSITKNYPPKIELQKMIENDSPDCVGCVSGVYLVQYYILKGKKVEDIANILERLCVAFNYGNQIFCYELSHLLTGTIVEILSNTTNTPREVCSFVYNLECGNGDVPGHRWKIPIPGNKPPVKLRVPPEPATPKFKVLHIADTHYDPLYKEGAADFCEMWMCCRADSGKGNATAGYWGGWKCDIPERTLEDFLKHANQTHPDLDYIIWTGDIPAHATWSQTKEESIFMLRSTVHKIRKYFPKIPIFPALGNHEACPANKFPSPSLNKTDVNSWLYEEVVKQWSLLLPEKTNLSTIAYAGFYVAQASPKLKIISLNTNFCYYNNWWLILNSTDPADMLSWFTDQLLQAEAANIKVHVIGHVPPGYIDCLKIWGENFYNIISRFENTVTAQFYSHTHSDEIEIFYDSETKKRAVSVGYVGPSVTTYTYANPGYRVYTIDGDHNDSSYELFDYDTWVMDLNISNAERKSFWNKLYTAKEAYGMVSLLPEEWNNFYERLKTDLKLLLTYNRHYWKDSPLRPPCLNGECRRDYLFDMRSGVHYGPPEF